MNREHTLTIVYPITTSQRYPITLYVDGGRLYVSQGAAVHPVDGRVVVQTSGQITIEREA